MTFKNTKPTLIYQQLAYIYHKLKGKFKQKGGSLLTYILQGTFPVAVKQMKIELLIITLDAVVCICAA